MRKVKITVLRKTMIEDLAKEYGVEGLTKCPMLKEGQVFYADYAKPEGFCDEAWKAIYQYVFALAHGASKEIFYFGDWIKNQVWLYAAVMMVYDLLSSSWKLQMKNPQLIIHLSKKPINNMNCRVFN